jgi:hypothetical protein
LQRAESAHLTNASRFVNPSTSLGARHAICEFVSAPAELGPDIGHAECCTTGNGSR